MKTKLITILGAVLAGTACLTCLSLAQAQSAPSALSKNAAEAAIQKHTRIGICADADPPFFQSLLTAPAVQYKPLFGAQETQWLYPVKASYTVHCTQGNRNMHYGPVREWQIEVSANFRLYRDPFGELQIADFEDEFSSDDQYWSNEKAAVRCRAKSLAFLTYDAAGTTTKRRVDPTTAFGDCAVRLRNAH